MYFNNSKTKNDLRSSQSSINIPLLSNSNNNNNNNNNKSFGFNGLKTNKWWTMNDNWMKVVNSPIQYRVGSNRLSFRLNPKNLILAFFFLVCLFFIYIVLFSKSGKKYDPSSIIDSDHLGLNTIIYEHFNDGVSRSYNSKYPLTSPIRDIAGKTTTFSILAIADLDTNSKLDPESPKFTSYLLGGKLTVSDDLNKAKLEFDAEPVKLNSEYSYGDRGMELSELVIFNGKLYSCDDRTGIIYEILPEKKLAIPWVVLVDGDGRNTSKGFKCEWMTVKDRKLYVGGLGKEWTTSKGEFVNNNPQWIKVVGHLGDVSHLNWGPNYNSMRAVGGYNFPGYMIFESGAWNTAEHKWYFLPRRASKDAYDEKLDEQRATNLMITSSESFHKVSYQTIGNIVPIRGYSSFKFVPNSNEKLLIALKSEEDAGQTRTYATVFNTNGFILINDVLISDKFKYEGIEFV